jgi:nucleotide-binding universal stress UspA family protein
MSAIFKRPLLATEHTEYDTGSEKLALALASKCGATLAIVLPVRSNPEYEMLAPQLAERAETDAANKLQALGRQARQAHVTVEVQARRGPEPYREIVDRARELASDLLIIRRRGKRGLLANLLLGEMVHSVVAHAPCSVLVASRVAQMWSCRVLAAVDPRTADMAPVATAAAIAAECALPLSVVAVTDAAAEALQQADDVLQRACTLARACGVAVTGVVRTGRPHEQIVATAREFGADLLVIGRHGGDTPGRAWLGGVAQKVIGLADLPVLVCINPTPNEHATP